MICPLASCMKENPLSHAKFPVEILLFLVVSSLGEKAAYKASVLVEDSTTQSLQLYYMKCSEVGNV